MSDPILIPAPVDPRRLDPTEASIVGGLFHAKPDMIEATLRTLHPTDLTAAPLLAVVRSVRAVHTAGARVDVPAVSATAIREGIVKREHRANLEALCSDLTGSDVTAGEPALWHTPELIDRSARRAVKGHAERLRQAAEETAADELVTVIRDQAAALAIVADRLEREVLR